MEYFQRLFSIPLAAAGEAENPLLIIIMFLVSTLPEALPFVVLVFMLMEGLTFLAFGFVGAINAMQGNAFAYVFIGKRARTFLAEENNQSAMG